MTPKRVLIDMDDTLVDFQGALLEGYAARTGEYLERGIFKSWTMTDYVAHPGVLTAVFHKPGFFAKLRPYPWALETVKSLHEAKDEHGRPLVEVIIASRPCTPHSAAEKMAWVEQWMPWLPIDRLVLGSQKHLMRADIIVDDALHFVTRYREEWPTAKVMGIAFPHNEVAQGIQSPFHARVQGYDRLDSVWLEMGRKLREWLFP